MMGKRTSKFLIVGCFLLFALGSRLLVGQAMGQDLVVSPDKIGLTNGSSLNDVNDYPLPPRPTPAPSSRKNKVDGGFIELAITPDCVDCWTRVQWQDSWGEWHDVEGWQGSFNEIGLVLWWVDSDDLGKGPFRWVVLDRYQGSMLAKSEVFDLPDLLAQTVRLELTLSRQVMRRDYW